MTSEKRKTITCRCNAYPFPHRWKGGKCLVPRPQQFTDQEMEDQYCDWQGGVLMIKNLRLIMVNGPEYDY